MSNNFNSTTPAAPAGKTNVFFQADKNGNISAYYTPGGGGGGGDLIVSVTLTAADITALIETPFVVVPAQGLNTIIIPRTVVYELVSDGTPFIDNSSNTDLWLNLPSAGSANFNMGPTGPAVGSQAFFNNNQNTIGIFGCPGAPSSGSIVEIVSSAIMNKPLYFANTGTSGDMTGGGGSTLIITVYYQVLIVS